MSLQAYLRLRNGTDVRGVACEGIEGESVTLTEEIASRIAKAFCVWLVSRTGKTAVRIAVGHDSRITSPALCEAVVGGIVSTGHDALVTGLSTTPSMFMLLKDEKKMREQPCHGSIMITASHLPFNRNGLKFFSPEGGLEGDDVKEILTLAADYRFAEVQTLGKKINFPYLDDYANALVRKVREATGEETPLSGKKIVVDAGNGAGGFFANKVLQPLGADTAGSQFLEPDGRFPNHIPNPENAEAMHSICEAVKKANADLGIIFDTDVDRAGAVDKDGSEINRNRLIALISAILLSERKGTIVTDSVTSDGLAKFIKARGGVHHRYKRGYKNVINEAIRLNAQGEYTPLAIETSGHAAFLENYFLDDGAYLITRLLIALAKAAKQGKQLTDQISDLAMPAEALELRVRFIGDVDFKKLGNEIIEAFKAQAETLSYATPATDNREGFRLRYDDAHGNGWILLRMSLHDPVMPINVESDDKDGAIKIVKEAYYFLKKYEYLDLSAFEKAIAAWREKKTSEANARFAAVGKAIRKEK